MKKLTYCCLAGLSFIPIVAIADNNTFDTTGMFYTYPVTIDGKQYTFILDMAASESGIDTHLASKLQNLVTKNTLHKSSHKTDSKQTVITIPEIQLGDKTIKQAQFKYMHNHAKDNEITNVGFHIDGILGKDIYQQFIWYMDNKNKKLRIYSMADTAPANDFKQCVHYNLDNPRSIPVITDISKDNVMLPFALSTVNVFSALDSSKVKSLPLVNINESIPGVSKKSRSFYYYMENIRFANLTIPKYLFDATHISDLTGNGFLGLDFLSRFDQFRLNPKDHSLCFNHFDADKKIWRDIDIKINKGNITVSSVTDADYLKKTGLKTNDIIVSINNEKYPPIQLTTVMDIIRHSKNLDLEINRNGKISHIIINADDS